VFAGWNNVVRNISFERISDIGRQVHHHLMGCCVGYHTVEWCEARRISWSIMRQIAIHILALLMPLMQSATTPLRTGVVARQLSQEDIAGIERTLPSGSTPSFLNGDRPQNTFVDYIEAYLSPTSTGSALRRGTVIGVRRQRMPAGEWSVERTDLYAQVAIPGRRFDDIQGDQDTNRPFRIIGRFDDDELVRLVQFLRSDPPIRGGEHIQSWPILSVQRKVGDSAEVMLREEYWKGQAVTLRQSGQDWVIVNVGRYAY
jgi:hypothetical protein